MIKKLDENLLPIHGNAIYHVNPFGVITETIYFDFFDPDEYYSSLTHNLKAHQEEISILWRNMQYFLDHELIFINNSRCTQDVVYVNYDHHGDSVSPYIYFVIHICGPPFQSHNIVLSDICIDQAEYDFEIVWAFPPGAQINGVSTQLEHETIGPILNLWGRKGDQVGGQESIEFDLMEAPMKNLK